MRYLYIEPKLERVNLDSIHEGRTTNSYIPKEYIKGIGELYSSDFTIIIGEPGNGKSRLLKEIVLQAKKANKKALYIDTKSLQGENLVQTITNFFKVKPAVVATNEDIKLLPKHFNSERLHFKRSIKDIIICFDALDEVKSEEIHNVIEKIKKFHARFVNVQIVLSCRGYSFKEYASLFRELNPKLFKIADFDMSDLFEYLKAHGFSENEIIKVRNHFFSGFFQLNLINNPRILEIFVSIKQKETLESALNKTKAELLGHFIYSSLDEQEKKKNKKGKDIVKRILEKLAITMGIYQSNEISRDELLTFFDDIKSNLSRDFLGQVSADDFLERALLVPVDGNKLQFQNVEFQEYLAAVEICRMNKVNQLVFDVMVTPELRRINPAWINTLKYVLELKQDLQLEVIEFICRAQDEPDLDLIEKIIISDINIIKKISIKHRKAIFTTVFNAFKASNSYINYLLAAKFYPYCMGMEDEIKREFENTKGDNILLCNIISLVNHSIESLFFSDVDYWKNEVYQPLLKNTNVSTTLKILVLEGSVNFKDYEFLQRNFKYEVQSKEVFKEYIKACIAIDPNRTETIDLICDLVKNDRLNSLMHPSFDAVTSKESFVYLLKKLISDEDLLRSVKLLSYEFSLKRTLNHLRHVYDEEIKELLVEIILLPESFVRHDSFLSHIIKFLSDVEPEFLFQIFWLTKKRGLFPRDWYKINDIFALLLTAKNTKSFISEANTDIASQGALIHLFYSFRNTKNQDESQIFEISREFFANQYDELGKRWSDEAAKWDRSASVYKEFSALLTKRDWRVFFFFKNNRELLLKSCSPSDVDGMREIFYNQILLFDFTTSEIRITKQGESTRSFTVTNNIRIFGCAVDLAADLGINLSNHRAKLLEFLPYSFWDSKTEVIFQALGPLNSEEFEKFVSFYDKKRDDDLHTANIGNFFDACRFYKLIQGIPFLKKIIEDQKFEDDQRLTAFDIINSLQLDLNYIKNVFITYSSGKSNFAKSICDRANSILIRSNSEHSRKAIIWRMNKVLRNREISPTDSEGWPEHRFLHLAQPLYEVVDTEFINEYLDFLDKTIKLYNKNIEYRNYATSLWEIVFSFFGKLVSTKSFVPLQKLESYILKYRGFEKFRALNIRVSKIKAEFLSKIAKPNSYSECVRKYNELKEKNYLHVSSPTELFYTIQEVIEKDLREWIEKEGAYKMISKYRDQETLIQKTIKTQFENCLMRRGLRSQETEILRETQLLDDKRTDFIVAYGFIGQIIIEIKLTKNSDIKSPTKSKQYPKKLIQYIDGTKSNFAIMLVLQVSEKDSWMKMVGKIDSIYKAHENKIKVIGLNCLGN
jgi:hypothetical protein